MLVQLGGRLSFAIFVVPHVTTNARPRDSLAQARKLGPRRRGQAANCKQWLDTHFSLFSASPMNAALPIVLNLLKSLFFG
jgi:hypothetical protein